MHSPATHSSVFAASTRSAKSWVRHAIMPPGWGLATHARSASPWKWASSVPSTLCRHTASTSQSSTSPEAVHTTSSALCTPVRQRDASTQVEACQTDTASSPALRSSSNARPPRNATLLPSGCFRVTASLEAAAPSASVQHVVRNAWSVILSACTSTSQCSRHQTARRMP